MNKIRNKTLISLMLTAVLFACNSPRKDDPVVARVYNKYLYLSDLQGVVPENVKGPDSVQIVRSYIDNWVRQAVVLHKAERNIDLSRIDIQKQLIDYKNSLLIYHYEQALVDTKLDTLVTEKALRTYYEGHKEDFRLPGDVYRIAWVEVSEDVPDIQRLPELLAAQDEEARDELAHYCLQYALRESLNDTTWHAFEELAEKLPLGTVQEEEITSGKTFEIKNKNTVFLLTFREVRRKDEISPFEMEKQHIRNIILNRRKLDLLATMEKEVYEDALKNNDFEIY